MNALKSTNSSYVQHMIDRMILRSYSDKSQAMFTLYWILKQSVAETVPDKDSVHTRNAAFGTISDPEQDYFVPFLKDTIPATQRSTCSCTHCTGSLSATLRFTTRYSVNIALTCCKLVWICRKYSHDVVRQVDIPGKSTSFVVLQEFLSCDMKLQITLYHN